MPFRAVMELDNSASNSITPAPPTNLLGDVLIAAITQDGNGATLNITGGGTWTVSAMQNITNGDTQTCAWAWKYATASEPATYTVTGTTGNGLAVIIASYSGANQTTAIDTGAAAPTINNPNSVSPPSSPVSVVGTGLTTSTVDDIILLGFVDTNGQDGVWTAPSAMTLRKQVATGGSFLAMALFDLSQVSAGAVSNQTAIWTQAGAVGNFVGFLIALAPPPSPAASNIAWMPSSSVVFHYID